MTTFLIGIDDTDNIGTPGTGQLARRISHEISRYGGKPLGITRHQLLVDPQIPYTAHNRGICIATDWHGPITDLDFVFDRTAEFSAEGSDPGVCITPAASVPQSVIEWGQSATHTVLTMDACRSLAQKTGLILRPLGGTGQGIIGALASVGLRAGGNHGRFVDLPGLRDLGESVSATTLSTMGIHIEHQIPVTTAGNSAPASPSPNHTYKTLGWVRPRLLNGKPVLSVEWSDDHAAWVPVDRKKVHPVE